MFVYICSLPYDMLLDVIQSAFSDLQQSCDLCFTDCTIARTKGDERKEENGSKNEGRRRGIDHDVDKTEKNSRRRKHKKQNDGRNVNSGDVEGVPNIKDILQGTGPRTNKEHNDGTNDAVGDVEGVPNIRDILQGTGSVGGTTSSMGNGSPETAVIGKILLYIFLVQIYLFRGQYIKMHINKCVILER